jgi:hypothetical protein
MLLLNNSRQRYYDRVFLFSGQGDYWRNDQIARIDVVLSRGVYEPLFDQSIVATLLKFIILMRMMSKNSE